jgi:hypothetical protein
MALTPGLSPSLRLPPEPPGPAFEASDVVIEEAPAGADMPVVDDKGAVLKIEHPDGSVTITMDGSPLRAAGADRRGGWWDNLVDDIDDLEQSRIAEELLRGITADDTSRQDWIEQREKGLQLLGLRPELPGLGGSADGAPVEGISRVRHPLLLEAVLRFQANARSELLPTDGPVKVRDDGNGADINQDRLADALEKDLNHYLTAVASEYYPDTDRMLFSLGFGGTAFKKVYFCPLRNRPVSETVDANDLIVSQSATDLQNAKRITHRVMLRSSTVKRLQILGVYKDVELHTPNAPKQNAFDLEKKAQEGISVDVSNPEDRDREIYECYCELDVKGFEHKIRGKETGLEIPYCVTIDVSSRKILSITRNYNEDTKDLPEARKVFVKYVFVPGFEFYGIGLLHILGNTTNAITAAWRELLDAGMYSNFPGFLFADVGARQNTSIFRVPPGGGSPIKTGGMPISQAVMPLPYKEPSAALMTLVDNMANTGMRIGGTSEQQVGEGRSDAPVGTTLALIDQATKVLNSVHKRLHAAQAEEFQMLIEVFKEHPDSFWQRNRKPTRPWDEQTFLQALEDCNLVPQADPNTASHTQRVMKVMALKQLQAAQPSLYDPIAIDRAALQAIGFNNPEQFFAPPPAQASPPPELMQVQAQIRQGDTMAQAAKTAADARMLDAQTKAAKEGMSAPQQQGGLHPHEVQLKAADLRLKRQNMVEQANAKDRDRMAQIEIEKMKLIGQAMRDAAAREHERQMTPGLGGIQGNA